MTIRLHFSASDNFGARLIRLTTWSRWSHVELIDGHDLIGANWPGGVEVVSRLWREVRSKRWAVAEVPGDPRPAIAWARTQLGRPYDTAGVLGIATRRRWQDDDAWFCSELVAAALWQAGTQLVRVDQWRVTPQHLWQSPLVRVTETHDED